MSLSAPSLAFLACVLSTEANAQVVRGRVVDATNRPVVAAMIVLTDSTHAPIAVTLSDSTGAYALQARGAGRHHLTIGRIGFASHDETVQVRNGETNQPITLNTTPVNFGAVRAGDIVRCGDDPVARTAWAEARKTLQVIVLAEAQGLIRVRGIRYLRELSANARSQLAVIEQDTFTAAAVPGREPPATAPPGHWFAIADSIQPQYFAVSARALASDDFERNHCFTRLTSDDVNGGRVGLTFVPRSGVSVISISGTMWLERSTGRLQSVEYTYRAGQGSRAINATGLVEFNTPPNAVPHVARWWLRMPVTRTVTRSQAQEEMRSVVEDGVLVLNRLGDPVSDPDDVLPTLRGAYSLGPIVVDANPTGRRPIVPTVSGRHTDVLSADEIRLTGGRNAYDLIRSMRPRWLRLRGGVRFEGSPTPVAVYVDGVKVRMREPITSPEAATEEVLRQISVASIEAMQYLDPIEAPAYFGMGNDNGAILITLRKS